MTEIAPLAGIRVVDLTQGLAGPEAAMLLAQYGADVVKVEPPEGDWSRNQGAKFGTFTDKTVANNRGKRSIALDLKSAAGKAVLMKLAAKADVFMEAFRPGVAERLGIGYADIAAINPGIVYLSISGFGQRGPLRERPATDAVIQAFSGLMQVNKGSVDGLPHRLGFWVIDMVTGLYAFQAISMALMARRAGAPGRHLDCSLMQSAGALQSIRMMEFAIAGGEGAPSTSLVGTFQAADGWLNIAVMNDRDWLGLCRALGLDALAADPGLATVAGRQPRDAEIKTVLRERLATQDCAHWGARLTAERILFERVHDYLDYLAHPQVAGTEAVAWIDHPDIGRVPVPTIPASPPTAPDSPMARAPQLAEHTEAILGELGYRADEIAALAAAGAVRLQT